MSQPIEIASRFLERVRKPDHLFLTVPIVNRAIPLHAVLRNLKGVTYTKLEVDYQPDMIEMSREDGEPLQAVYFPFDFEDPSVFTSPIPALRLARTSEFSWQTVDDFVFETAEGRLDGLTHLVATFSLQKQQKLRDEASAQTSPPQQ